MQTTTRAIYMSVARNQKGLFDPHSDPLLRTIQYIVERKPSTFIIENVPNIKKIHDGKCTASLWTHCQKAVSIRMKYTMISTTA